MKAIERAKWKNLKPLRVNTQKEINGKKAQRRDLTVTKIPTLPRQTYGLRNILLNPQAQVWFFGGTRQRVILQI